MKKNNNKNIKKCPRAHIAELTHVAQLYKGKKRGFQCRVAGKGGRKEIKEA